MDSTRERIMSSDGTELYYEDSGHGDPLLLLHGFTGCGADWAQVFDLGELAHGHRLIVPDLRGHGRSTNPAGTFTHRQCAGDAIQLLDHLGVERCRAVGLSCGGNVLLHLATAQPARVAAMVLVSAPSYFPKEARAIMAMVSEDGHGEEEWRVMRARHHHGDEQIRTLWRQANAFKDSYDDMNFTPPLLGTIRARTLLVSGDRDPLYPLEIFVEMHRAIAGSALWIVPDGGHGPIFGDAREAFARTALRFLEGDATP